MGSSHQQALRPEGTATTRELLEVSPPAPRLRAEGTLRALGRPRQGLYPFPTIVPPGSGLNYKGEDDVEVKVGAFFGCRGLLPSFLTEGTLKALEAFLL